jgi:hypothetical protein
MTVRSEHYSLLGNYAGRASSKPRFGFLQSRLEFQRCNACNDTSFPLPAIGYGQSDDERQARS